jgi:protein-tyrosine-phosphatase
MNDARVSLPRTGNFCRPQMAEAFLRHYGRDTVEVACAGSADSGPAVDDSRAR